MKIGGMFYDFNGNEKKIHWLKYEIDKSKAL